MLKIYERRGLIVFQLLSYSLSPLCSLSLSHKRCRPAITDATREMEDAREMRARDYYTGHIHTHVLAHEQKEPRECRCRSIMRSEFPPRDWLFARVFFLQKAVWPLVAVCSFFLVYIYIRRRLLNTGMYNGFVS